MQAQLRPHRRERGEDLGPGEGVAAVGQRRGIRSAAEQHEVVAGLADAEREHLAGRRALLHEPQRVDAAIGQHLGDAGPHQVHVDRERRRGRRTRQALLEDGCLGEAQPRTAQLAGHEDRQVSGILQVRQIVVGERVLAVVHGRPGAEALEEFVREEVGDIVGGHPAILAP